MNIYPVPECSLSGYIPGGGVARVHVHTSSSQISFVLRQVANDCFYTLPTSKNITLKFLLISVYKMECLYNMQFFDCWSFSFLHLCNVCLRFPLIFLLGYLFLFDSRALFTYLYLSCVSNIGWACLFQISGMTLLSFWYLFMNRCINVSIFSLWFVIFVLKIPFYSENKDIFLYYLLKTV